MADVSEAKQRLLQQLVTRDHATASQLARALGLTDAAIRQHLDALETAGLVEPVALPAAGRGRPATAFRLLPAAHDYFPDRHDDLTAELLSAISEALGDDALDEVLAVRARRQRSAYAAAVPPKAPLAKRVEILASLRTAEGYLAEATSLPDGSMTLVEHHCPIADAARGCGGLCDHELAVFQAVIGPGAEVERTQHLLAGDGRCSYHVRPR